MTDIQRHLKGIRKILATAIESTPDNAALDIEAVRQHIRAYLPAGYGVTSGVVGGTHGESLPLQIIIYDVPLAGDKPEAIHIEHTLMVIDVAAQYDAQTFDAALQRLQSVKALKPVVKPARKTVGQAVGQSRLKIPKERLPYALMYTQRLTDAAPTEAFFTHLRDALSVYSQAQRPDEIVLRGQNIQYVNPLIDDETPHEHAVGLRRTPNLAKPPLCYSCKLRYLSRHFFYEQLCPKCGDFNYHKRTTKADLQGYIALVTGARLKIGYETALLLLRAGAEVIATSRFPRDTARRYAQEAGFETWRARLHIYGIDMRQIGRLELFVDYLYERYPYLDILVNNAAQTIKRPAAYYAHLLPFEGAPMSELPSTLVPLLGGGDFDAGNNATASLAAESDEAYFPKGKYDRHGQQVDNRPHNSWVTTLDEVSVSEILEVHLVNAVAPAVLAGQLKGLMQRSPHEARHIVNVSAAEGRFATFKQGYHPHTNMAKAALNMLTRSIAGDYAAAGIFVNSVDPGWVSDQVPRTDEETRNAIEDRLPIDMLDAAARLCEPIFNSVLYGQHVSGLMLKDYRSVWW